MFPASTLKFLHTDDYFFGKYCNFLYKIINSVEGMYRLQSEKTVRNVKMNKNVVIHLLVYGEKLFLKNLRIKKLLFFNEFSCVLKYRNVL